MAVADQLVCGPTKGQPIPEGSVIFCPGCGSGLYEVNRSVISNVIRFSADCFESLTEHPFHSEHVPLICPECNRLIVGSLGRFWYRPPRRQYAHA